jgi:deoxyribodipyrimidine photolyase-related protein
MKTLRLILGDQLNAQHSWFRERNGDHLYLIAELHQEQRYVKHHVQKIVAFFIAMQRFAEALTDAGHQVLHLTLDETAKYHSLEQLILAICQQHQIEQIEFQRPDEIRLLEQLRNLKTPTGVGLREVDTEHFLLPFDEISKEFKPQRSLRMEAFYRRMRQRYGYLMQNGEPEGDRWNFDSENRKALKAADLVKIPQPLCFSQSTQAVLERLARHKINHFGEIGDQLVWPTSRKEALQLLEFFCTHCLPLFGQFQDAMTANSEHKWSLYHSRLSFALNAKMISPAQVIERSIAEYRTHPELINLAQIEAI